MKTAWTLALTAACGLAARPSLAQAQRCRVSEIEVPAVQVRVGAREQLLVIFRDASGIPCNEDPAYTATTNNSSIARIDHGYVVGVAAGATVLNVRTGTGRLAKTGSGAVTVTAEAPSVPSGAVAPQPVATPQPQPVATVPVNARGVGAATLAYQPPGNAPAVGILTDPARMELLPSERRFLRYHVVDQAGVNAQPLPLQFAVEPSAALLSFQIDSIGIVSASDTGRGAIRVSAVGNPNVRQALVPVEVRRDSVAFGRRLVDLVPGSVDTVKLRVVSQNRDLDLGQVYQFASSDTAVATVHVFEPVIEARRPGIAVITATNPLLRPVQTSVNVFRPVAQILAPETSLTVAIRQTQRATLRPLAADSSFVHEAPYTVRVLDTTRVQARYDSAAGVVVLTGRASGSTSVTMRVQNGKDSASAVARTIHVRVVAGGLLLSRTRAGMSVGERLPLTVALLDDTRQPIVGVTPEVRWTSTDSSVARVDSNQVVARSVGHARLTARSPWDSTATFDVVVGPDLLVIRQHAGAWNIFGRSTSGTWTPLTSDSLVESYPAWSPDLMHIAYVVRPAGRPRGGDLWIANADGSEAHRVFGTDSTTVANPEFVGPSGDQLVFEVSIGQNNRAEIWMVGADGRNPHKLPLGPQTERDLVVRAPAPSPDGRRILYQSLRRGSRGYDIYLANIDGSGERRMTTWSRHDMQPVWAADGNSFYFLRDEGDVQREVPVAPRPAAGQPVAAAPAGEMVFARSGKAKSQRIFRQAVTDTVATGVSRSGWWITAFGVSGDGSTIFATIVPEEDQPNVLASLNVATGAMTEIALPVGDILQGTPAAPRPGPVAAAPAGAPTPTPAPASPRP